MNTLAAEQPQAQWAMVPEGPLGTAGARYAIGPGSAERSSAAFSSAIVSLMNAPAPVSEPADVEVCWDEGKSPVFTQWPQRGYTPAWSVPYGSFFDYFKTRLGVTSGPISVDILLLGGWDTTSFYGHESELYDAINGGT